MFRQAERKKDENFTLNLNRREACLFSGLINVHRGDGMGRTSKTY